MPNDKWGLPFFYPTKSGGFFFQQSDDIRKDSEFDGDEISSSGGGQFTYSYSGPTAFVLAEDPGIFNGNAIGGCSNDFSEDENRGYAYKSSNPRDIELKMLINVTSLDSGLSISQTNGSHSSSNCCSGFAYMITMELQNSPSSFRFRKEMTHPNYFTDPKNGEWTHPKCNFKIKGHGWVGVCFVKYDKKDGISSGHDSVVCEFWFNPNPVDKPLDWTMLKRTEDKGGWGSGGDHCNGKKDQVGAWAGGKHRIKSNGQGDVQFKHVSLREIDPTASFDSNPPDDSGSGSGSGGTGGDVTTTTEVKGLLTLNRDINSYTTNACSTAGAHQFYGSSVDGNSWDLGYDVEGNGVRNKIGYKAVTASSILVGKKIQEADFYLSKVGSPTGTLSVVIRNSNDTLKSTIGTLDVTTLTGTETLTSFVNVAQTYTMQSGNYIAIEWTGGSSSDHVVVAKRNSLQSHSGVDGSNTQAFIHDSDGFHLFTNREIPGKIWESP